MGRRLASLRTAGRLLSRNRLRVAFAAILVLSAVVVAGGSVGGLSTATEADVPRAEPRDGHTVVTESGRAGTIVAYEPDGDVGYYDNSRTKYFDVDPVEGESRTVEYVATDTVHSSGPECGDPPCARNVIERANLSTGEVEVVFERVLHQETAGEWHDHVRINESHVLIADILHDRVYTVDTETGIVDWEWEAQADFDIADSGGDFPGDWTHLNDVSLLEDGRVMVSLRNHDRVVFVDPDEGVDHDWTLGAEDDYDVLFEQHNPDYIPEERGGPAVVVSDSENNRLQEFQRVDGRWERTWEWSDDRMQWPRDADRLPNGNTLVADTHGNRVMEIAPDGEIEWQVESTMPYDVERLETGDESAGGQSAAELGLESRTADGGADGTFDVLGSLGSLVRSVLPHRIHNAILFVSPVWMGQVEFAAAGVALLTGLTWAGLELRWRLRDAGIRFRTPVYRRGEE